MKTTASEYLQNLITKSAHFIAYHVDQFTYLKKPPLTLQATFLATHRTGTAVAIQKGNDKDNNINYTFTDE